MWRPADKCAFLRSYLRSSHFNMISPHPSQTHKLPNIKLIDSTFMYFCWGGSTAINANIRLARCFIVMLPSARIDRNGCPIHIMHSRSISNGPRIGAAANISSLWEQGARGCNGVECRRWLSECAQMVIEVCKHVLVKNPDDLLSLFQHNHATLGQFFSAINSKAKQSILLGNEHLDGTDKMILIFSFATYMTASSQLLHQTSYQVWIVEILEMIGRWPSARDLTFNENR